MFQAIDGNVVTFSGVDVSEPLIVPLLPEGDLDTVLLQHASIVIYWIASWDLQIIKTVLINVYSSKWFLSQWGED